MPVDRAELRRRAEQRYVDPPGMKGPMLYDDRGRRAQQYEESTRPDDILELLDALDEAEQRAQVAEKALEIAVRFEAGDRAMGSEQRCEDCEEDCKTCRIAHGIAAELMAKYRVEARVALGLPPAEEAGPAAPDTVTVDRQKLLALVENSVRNVLKCGRCFRYDACHAGPEHSPDNADDCRAALLSEFGL